MHPIIDGPQHYKKVHFEPTLFGRSGQDYEKMRFRIFYDASMNKLPPEFKMWTQEAANFWSDALSVRPYNGTIFIERDCIGYGFFDIYSNELKRHEKYCSVRCAPTTKCAASAIPEEHLKECAYCLKNGKECQTTGQRGKGIENADMVFYVSAIETDTCSPTMTTYATPCALDPYLDRPIAGGINICPFAAVRRKKEGVLSILKHEMMHALGFIPSLYNYFRDSNGKPLVGRDEYGRPQSSWFKNEYGGNVIKTVARKWHVRGAIVISDRTFIITPNVVREARDHFNCSELEGAELEDYGLAFSAEAHWESRVYLDDIMEGSTHGKERVSRIDFALLEDTGWYKVNYSFAEPMEYGKGLGCDFCMKSCKFWMDEKRKEGKSVEPFCDQTEEKSLNYRCNKTEKILSVCPLRRHLNPVQKKYQYFDKIEGVKEDDVELYSGISMLPDYCPIPLAVKHFCNEPLTPEEEFSHINDPLKNIPLEGFGYDSYCFESPRKWTLKMHKETCRTFKQYWTKANTGCYKYLCLNGRLVIEILNKQFPCFFERQVLEISLFGPSGSATHEGTIVCPSCVEMCGKSPNFKCKPDNPNVALRYLYVKDECEDGGSLETKNTQRSNTRQSTTVTNAGSNDKRCTYSTIVPIQLITNLVTFVIIKIFI